MASNPVPYEEWLRCFAKDTGPDSMADWAVKEIDALRASLTTARALLERADVLLLYPLVTHDVTRQQWLDDYAAWRGANP